MQQKLTHGGDWAGFEAEYGRPPLDFSANVSPLGVPWAVRRAVAKAARQAARYPDPLCRRLTEALARHESVKQEQILCGNGAADLIYRLAYALRPQKALVTAPTFAEYELALKEAGCRVERHFLLEKEEFRLTAAFLEKLRPPLDLAVLCNPNNPTGQPVEPGLLRQIAQRCREQKIRLLLDECFLDFLEEKETLSLVSSLEEFPNVLILKAFTKSYAMAGIRLGYLLSRDEPLLAALRRAGQPWAVSSLAQAAGLAALKEQSYLEKSRQIIAAERERLRKALEDLGFLVLGSRANYLFFWGGPQDLGALLRQEGILLRSCDNYPGLRPGYYRAAVRRPEENLQLVAALTRVLAKRERKL